MAFSVLIECHEKCHAFCHAFFSWRFLYRWFYYLFCLEVVVAVAIFMAYSIKNKLIMKKGIIRTILDDHQDVALYKRAITDITLMLSHRNGEFRLQHYKEIPEMDYIIRKINELKSSFDKL